MTEAGERPTAETNKGSIESGRAELTYAENLNSKEPETVWNAFPYASATAAKGHRVSVFLLGPAVEIDDIPSDRFEVTKILKRFSDLGGETLSCGTCLRIRKMEASEACPMSTMDTLVRLTEEADRTVTFG